MRHSCEHVLTIALMRLFPDVRMAMGPATDEGFYFDFASDSKISEEDFGKIEKEMKKIVKQKLPFVREEVSIEKARTLFADNPYKLEWIDEIEERGEAVTLYRTGDEFVDLCSGPHVEHTGQIGSFKLLSMAGAYWRGNENNTMLTRIYGTCFHTKDELYAYVKRIEEAKKRDHKKLGKELGLFTFSQLVGSGLPLWTPKGTLIRILLDDYVWKLRSEKGYQKVCIPHITKKDLYETSGHWNKFKDELFQIKTREDHLFAMKPMNCPHHTQIFASERRSYRDMPQRYAETTMVYRDEQSGELSGLSRVRSITQDDAHVFCRQTQIKDEFLRIWDIVETFYQTFGFDLQVRLSLHDPQNMDAYLGTNEMWEMAENALRDIAKEKQVSYTEAQGEAAFYGPKIDFMGHDSLGREWQLATIQLDVNMPEQFGLFCINEDGEEERVIMIHAAIMGAIERFMSILIEHYAGAFPLWLAPVQVSIIPVSDKYNDHAAKVQKVLQDNGVRSEVDTDNKTVSYKIRHSTLQKVPYMVIIGEHEMNKSTESELFISARSREKEDLGMQSTTAFISYLHNHIESTKQK
jgi:threonyl-tRNA synthetase